MSHHCHVMAWRHHVTECVESCYFPLLTSICCDQVCDLQLPSDEAVTGPNQYCHPGAGLGASPSLRSPQPQPLLTCSQPLCRPSWLSHTTNPPHKLQLVVPLNLLCGLLCPGHSVEHSRQAIGLLPGPLTTPSGGGIWAGLPPVDSPLHSSARGPQAVQAQACVEPLEMIPPLAGGGTWVGAGSPLPLCQFRAVGKL